MTLTEEILSNWNTDINYHVHYIPSLKETTFPAWTIKTDEGIGVLFLYDGDLKINESFSNAKIESRERSWDGVPIRKTLELFAPADEADEVFASLCAVFIDPGEGGIKRNKIIADPLEWWKSWKELLGNKNIDPKIYDVLGELCVIKKILESGEEPNWNGPDGASYDIELPSRFIEVKSTVSRNKREISINSQFQLKPEGKPLSLVLCQFERSILSGCSIDSVVNDIENLGYSTSSINNKLRHMGFENGMSSRKKTFILHDMLEYNIDDNFPRITPESFVGKVMPIGITKITYTVDLSGLPAVSIMQGGNHDIQNN